MTDIVERLHFDAVRCELQFSKGVASNIEAAAAEIERLRAQVAGQRKALETAHSFLDNSDSPGGCNGKYPECDHCAAISKVGAALASSPADGQETEGSAKP